MKILKTPIPDLLVLEPVVHKDERGFFFESYNKREFYNTTGLNVNFVQDNQSLSLKNTLRGMHYQIFNPQDKLVHVVRGEVYDVAIDLRESSTTFGKWYGLTLSAENHRQLFVPKGFAHGFVVLSEFAEFFYKVSDYYTPEAERSLRWNCSAINIDWPINDPVLNSRDANAKTLMQCEVFT